MNTHRRYPEELKERAVRMVLDHTPEYTSQWAAIRSIATKFGMTAARPFILSLEKSQGISAALQRHSNEIRTRQSRSMEN